MRARTLLVFLGVLALSPAASFARTRHPSVPLSQCPPEGDARVGRVRELNRLKRRMETPAVSDIATNVSLSAMLAPGDDRDRWDSSKAGTLTGYVADVKLGGVESVNCHARSAINRDSHIDLVLSGSDTYNEARHVIVEITPQWRRKMTMQGVDWSTSALRKQLLGRKVQVTGWLLFDGEHAGTSANTARLGANVWRATAWELHPITELRLAP